MDEQGSRRESTSLQPTLPPSNELWFLPTPTFGRDQHPYDRDDKRRNPQPDADAYRYLIASSKAASSVTRISISSVI